MKLAIIADIHGNSAALEAVLADMDSLAISDAINLGDHLSGPLDASGTAEILISRNFPSILGNHDRWLLETSPSEMGASDKVAFDQLTQTHLDWLRGMPKTLTLFHEIFACHGTPDNDLSYWLERVDTDGNVRAASLEEVEAEALGVGASLILCAHTHVPRVVRLRDGRMILNPGSVGCPGYDDDQPVYHKMQTGTPNASYAIAEKVQSGWIFTFRSVPYDSRDMVALAFSHGRDEWGRALATGWIDA